MKVIHDINGPVHGYGVQSARTPVRWALWLFLLWNCMPTSVIAMVKGNGILITPFSIHKVRPL